jgi:hypothetical protein
MLDNRTVRKLSNTLQLQSVDNFPKTENKISEKLLHINIQNKKGFYFLSSTETTSNSTLGSMVPQTEAANPCGVLNLWGGPEVNKRLF